MYFTLRIYHYRSHFGSRTIIYFHFFFQFRDWKRIMDVRYDSVMYNYVVGVHENNLGLVVSYFVNIGCNNNCSNSCCALNTACIACWPNRRPNVRISCQRITNFMKSDEQELIVNSYLTGNVSAILQKHRTHESVLVKFPECPHRDDGEEEIYMFRLSDMPHTMYNMFIGTFKIVDVGIEEFDQEIVDNVRKREQQIMNDNDVETTIGTIIQRYLWNVFLHPHFRGRICKNNHILKYVVY